MSVFAPTLNAVEVRRRDQRLLGPIDHELAPEGITMVLGPNGAGKTTFLRVLHGVERLSGGHLSWANGAPPKQAYVFQSPIMLRRSVRNNLAYPLQLLNRPKLEIDEKVTYWAAQIGLGDELERYAPRLSGGEKQKLALARALIRNPEVLFLDEPCANLDASSTREIETLLLVAKTAGTRIIMATHHMGQARRLADDVIFLLKGRVHDYGPAPDIFDTPDRPETSAFFKGDLVE